MIIKVVNIKEVVEQYCVFVDTAVDTPLACFLTENECQTWIEDYAK